MTNQSAALPGKADAEGWRRLHVLSPLLRGGITFLVIVGIVISSFRDRIASLLFAGRLSPSTGEDGEDMQGDIVDLIEYLQKHELMLLAIGAVLLVIALIVLIGFVSWWFATYRVTDEAVESRQGMLFRQHRRAPLERIQGVNLQRPLLARVLGLAKVQILTAGQGGKVELAYLSYGDAQRVREQLLRRAAAKRGDLQSEETPSSEAGLAAAGVTDPLSHRVNDFIDEDIDPEAVAANTLVRVPVGRLIASILLSSEILIIALITVGLIFASIFGATEILFGLIPMVLALGSTAFSMFNKGFRFQLSRGHDAIRVGAGLTATNTDTIPFGRVHAVMATQPLFWRPFGWWKVRITTAGYSIAQAGQNTMQNVVLPVGREDDVLRVIDTLLPGAANQPEEIAALHNGLSGPGEGYLKAGRRAFWVLLWGRKRAGLQLASDDTLRVRRGVITRSLSIMPLVRAQSVQVARPLVHRMVGLGRIQAHTVLGPVQMQMRGIGLEDAFAVFDDLERAVLRVQGADAVARMARARHREEERATAAPGIASDHEPGENA